MDPTYNDYSLYELIADAVSTAAVDFLSQHRYDIRIFILSVGLKLQQLRFDYVLTYYTMLKNIEK